VSKFRDANVSGGYIETIEKWVNDEIAMAGIHRDRKLT
jgi:hypothetical protein